MRQLPTSIQEESASDGGTGRWWAWWSERMHLVLLIGVPANPAVVLVQRNLDVDRPVSQSDFRGGSGCFARSWDCGGRYRY